MNNNVLSEVKRTFRKTFDELAYNRRKYQLFSDWLEWSSCFVHQANYIKGAIPPDRSYCAVEERFKTVSQKYEQDDLKQFCSLLVSLMNAYTQHPHDLIGEIYEALDLAETEWGQYFSPHDIARLMSRINLRDLPERLKNHDMVLICDDACGAGGLLIDAAEIVQEAGYDPRVVVQFEATDMDRNCFNMTYIQLSLLSLRAVVRHGNTLTLKMEEIRLTPQMQTYQHWKNLRPKHYSEEKQLLSDLGIMSFGEPEAAIAPSNKINITYRQLSLLGD